MSTRATSSLARAQRGPDLDVPRRPWRGVDRCDRSPRRPCAYEDAARCSGTAAPRRTGGTNPVRHVRSIWRRRPHADNHRGQFVDLGERSGGVPTVRVSAYRCGVLSLRGEHRRALAAAWRSTSRKKFGTRTSERFAPDAALFERPCAFFGARGAHEAAHVEDVTSACMATMRKLGAMRRRGCEPAARSQTSAAIGMVLQMAREMAASVEDARRASRKANRGTADTAATARWSTTTWSPRPESDAQKTARLLIEEPSGQHGERSRSGGRIAGAGRGDMQPQRCSLGAGAGADTCISPGPRPFSAHHRGGARPSGRGSRDGRATRALW